MNTSPNRWSSTIAGGIPPLLVCGVLAAVGYWGATTGWKSNRFSALFPKVAEFFGVTAADIDDDDDKPADGPVTEKAEGPADWCEKHGVADSLCPECHPDLITGATGRRPWASGDEVAIRSSHDPKQCRTHLDVIRFPSAEAVQLAGVKTATVTERSLAETVTAYGVAEYDEFQTAKLAPRAAGTIWAVYKRRGDNVRASDVVALVDVAEVGKAKAEFLQAAAQLDARTRARSLLHPDRTPERAIQEADAALREARARLFTAQQELLTLGMPLRGDEAALPDEQLRARLQFLGIPDEIVKALPANTTANLLPLATPFAGTVVDGIAVRGQAVAAREPLFTVSDLSSLHVLLDFRPEDAPRLAIGQRVEFRPDGNPGPPAVGELHWISPAVDEKTRMVHAHAEVPNPTRRLRANAFGTAVVTVRQHVAAVVVPAEAVQWEGCSYVVFPAESPTVFRPRKVRLGQRQDAMVEILIGLKPGEVVATAGSHVLKSHLFRDRLGAAEE
jgi:cobalt-zinc-cadmium efflux system membrane fusion protein